MATAEGLRRRRGLPRKGKNWWTYPANEEPEWKHRDRGSQGAQWDPQHGETKDRAPHTGGPPKEDPRVESAEPFGIAWGDITLICKLTWDREGNWRTEFYQQPGAVLSEADTGKIREFLSKIEMGITHSDAQVFAETHFPYLDSMLNWPQAWPWRTASKHFAWLDYLIPLTKMYTRWGEQRPPVETRYLKPSQAEMVISFLNWATRELENDIPEGQTGTASTNQEDRWP
jgi:hypothetical protein